mmetsp:Transcript_99254/g.256632  ORF Transcript_99254/g.256632 Transcript_99254/m.256632 type:complete len:599 (-) Transcript_99254:157-1953(-)
MVGRFESPQLTSEALAHEDLCARPGPVGRCFCVLATCIMTTGVFAVVPGLSGTWKSIRWSPAPAPRSAAGGTSSPGHLAAEDDLGSGYYRSGYSGSTLGSAVDYSSVIDIAGIPREKEEVNHLGLDFSLLAISISVLACCVVPNLLHALSSAPSWAASFASPQQPAWGQGQFQGQSSLLMPGNTGAFGQPDWLFGAPGAGRGRVIDVKPGELRGGAGGASGVAAGGAFGAPFGLGAFSWGGGQPAAAPMDWTSTTAQGAGGSWQSPVPSPWGNPSPGVLPSLGAAVASGAGQLGNALGSSLGSWLGFSGGMNHHHPGHAPGMLPTEAEVTETYAAFGVELQAWVPALASVIDREIIEPLIRGIDESNQLWTQALTPRGWRLTMEAPRLAFQGMGPSVQELSVFDRHLPRPLCDEPRAVELWTQRQKLEAYLVHPSFEPAQRQYVLERIREWRHRGLMASAIRFENRPADMMPTDAHIFENLLVKMLSFHLDFPNCFLTAGNSPPLQKHMGQPPAAYLRQVTDQSVYPRPPPHYEVVTMQKVWKVRAGSSNMLEAFALLLHALRRHSSRSYPSFPQAIRNAVEVVSPAASGPSRPMGWF